MTTTDARKQLAEKRELDLINFLKWLDENLDIPTPDGLEAIQEELIRRFLAQNAANDSGATIPPEQAESAADRQPGTETSVSSEREGVQIEAGRLTAADLGKIVTNKSLKGQLEEVQHRGPRDTELWVRIGDGSHKFYLTPSTVVTIRGREQGVTVEDLVGLLGSDWTGGMSSVEFVRKQRDGDSQ